MNGERSEDRKESGLHFVVRSSDGVAHKIPVIADDQKTESAISVPHHDSASWTGISLNAGQKMELVKNIDDAILKVDGLGLDQQKKSQVRAMLLAARILSEAPEPPFDIIRLLFGNVDRMIGIAGFFVGVAGLIANAV